MSASLRVVSAGQPIKASPKAPQAASVGERVRQLQAEAKRLAGEHVEALQAGLLHVQAVADEIAQGGEAYPPGARDLARRLSEDALAKMQTLEAIMTRR